MQTVGEVVIRGDGVMDGYYKDPQGTAAVMTKGLVSLRRHGRVGRENYIHIVDRKKDIIISGGENISSLEVEKAIFAHPAVLECAVVAAPDNKWGEIPAAFVVLKPGQALGADELCEFLAAAHRQIQDPARLRVSGDGAAQDRHGQDRKRELREMFWAGRAKRVQG
jgi:fatty-acyl-CoA synthase